MNNNEEQGKINFDLHTHTTYSHGTGSILDNAVSAKEKGLYGIAITDHGFSHPAFGMRRKYLDKMRAGQPDISMLTHNVRYNWLDDYPGFPRPYQTYSDENSYGPKGHPLYKEAVK